MGNEMSDGELASGTDDAGMSGDASDNGGDPLRLDAGKVVDNLLDIVSKNGNMMLNVGLRADGSLPNSFRQVLIQIGQWLKINGEGIYGTRPFYVYGEGPFAMPKTGISSMTISTSLLGKTFGSRPKETRCMLI